MENPITTFLRLLIKGKSFDEALKASVPVDMDINTFEVCCNMALRKKYEKYVCDISASDFEKWEDDNNARIVYAMWIQETYNNTVEA